MDAYLMKEIISSSRPMDDEQFLIIFHRIDGIMREKLLQNGARAVLWCHRRCLIETFFVGIELTERIWDAHLRHVI